MEKQITVTERNVYGNLCIYPACEMSKMLCEIAGTKQVTAAMIRTLKGNSFRIVVQPSQAREI